MIEVVGVRFRKAGKIYDFNNGALVLTPGLHVIVETEQGHGLGIVVRPPKLIDTPEHPLKNILRIATKEDFIKWEEIKELEKKAMNFCAQSLKSMNLEMNLFDVECTFDRKQLTFFYTADSRIDFRQLIRILAKEYNTNIEMRHVGMRNLAKHRGGIGKCGRELCCSSFMAGFEPVSIKMAKEQAVFLNPNKISGLCGRLMCCLTFEDYTYKRLRKKMPKLGKFIIAEEGEGRVIRHNVLKKSLTIRLEDKTEIEKSLQDIKFAKKLQ